MKRFIFALCAMLFAPYAFSDGVAPEIRWTVNVEEIEPVELGVRAGETVDFVTTWKNYGAAKNLHDANTVMLYYRPYGLKNIDWHYSATGTIDNATGGVTRIRFGAANQGTNSLYSYDIVISAFDTTMARGKGIIRLEGTSITGTNVLPRQYDVLDGSTTIVLNPGYFPWFYLVGSPIVGQSIAWNGTNWIPSAAGAGDVIAGSVNRFTATNSFDAATYLTDTYLSTTNIWTVFARYLKPGFTLSESEHGALGGSNRHASATSLAAGFMSALEYLQLQALGTRSNVWDGYGASISGLQSTSTTVVAWQNSVSGRLDNAGALTNWAGAVVDGDFDMGAYSILLTTNPTTPLRFGTFSSMYKTNIYGQDGMVFNPGKVGGAVSGHRLFAWSTDEGLFMSARGINGEMFLHGSNYISMSAGDIINEFTYHPTVALDNQNSVVVVWTGTNSDSYIDFGANGYPLAKLYPKRGVFDMLGNIISNVVLTGNVNVSNTLIVAGTNLGSTVAAQGVTIGTLQTSNANLYAVVITNGGASINGSPITNGASFTITGGSGGGLSNIVVAGVEGTLTGSGSNVAASVSLASLAGAGVTTNGQVFAAAQYPLAMTNGGTYSSVTISNLNSADNSSNYVLLMGNNSTTNPNITAGIDVGGFGCKPSICLTGDITKLYGETIKLSVLADGSDRTLTDQIGLFIEDALKGSNGVGKLTVLNSYGALINAQNNGSNNSFGVKIYGPTNVTAVGNYGLFVTAPSGSTNVNVGIYNEGSMTQIGVLTVSSNSVFGRNLFVGGSNFIGTVNTGALGKLHVESVANTRIICKTASASDGDNSGISFPVTTDTSAGTNSVRGGDITVTRQTGGSMDMGLYLSDASSNRELVRLKGASGNVGIGTNAPAALLDVNGTSLFRTNANFLGPVVVSNTLTMGGNINGGGNQATNLSLVTIYNASSPTLQIKDSDDGSRLSFVTYSALGQITCLSDVTTKYLPLDIYAKSLSFNIGPDADKLAMNITTGRVVVGLGTIPTTVTGSSVLMSNVTSITSFTNALTIGADTNLLTLGQGGPVSFVGIRPQVNGTNVLLEGEGPTLDATARTAASNAQATAAYASNAVSAGKIDITDFRLYLAGLNQSDQSVRGEVHVGQANAAQANDIVFTWTNILFFSCTSTVAGVAGEFTNVVGDASGFIRGDMYTKPSASPLTWQNCSNGVGTVIYWNNKPGADVSSNKVNNDVGTTVSRVGRYRVPDYYDDMGGTSVYCNVRFLTPYTNTVGIYMRYWSRTNCLYTNNIVVSNSQSFVIPYVR
jgi:hypothetical protein